MINKELNNTAYTEENSNNVPKETGIPADYFLRNTNYLKDKHETV